MGLCLGPALLSPPAIAASAKCSLMVASQIIVPSVAKVESTKVIAQAVVAGGFGGGFLGSLFGPTKKEGPRGESHTESCQVKEKPE